MGPVTQEFVDYLNKSIIHILRSKRPHSQTQASLPPITLEDFRNNNLTTLTPNIIEQLHNISTYSFSTDYLQLHKMEFQNIVNNYVEEIIKPKEQDEKAQGEKIRKLEERQIHNAMQAEIQRKKRELEKAEESKIQQEEVQKKKL